MKNREYTKYHREMQTTTEEKQKMKKRLYQVYDTVAEMGLGPIMMEVRDGPALRTFVTVLADKTTQLGQRPDDYELRYIGDYDEDTQEISRPPNCPRTVTTGRAWVEEQHRRIDQATT